MTVLDALKTEHDLMEGLIHSIDRAFRYDEENSRRELRKALLVLLPALERHEQIEDLAFGGLPCESPECRLIHKRVAGQHLRIEALRGELLEALKQLDGYPLAELRSLALSLNERLQAHFLTEESQLWPLYARNIGRSLNHSLERRAAAQVRELERQIRETRSQVHDYLEGRR